MFTTDTRHPHCPIYIVYTLAMAGDRLHASELDARPWALRTMRPLAVIKLTEYSDYSGSDVEASNHRVLADRADELRLVEIIGSHGYKALAYDATLGPVPWSEDLVDIIEQLENHPLLDEEDQGELESDLEQEAWEDHGLDDFRKALSSLLDKLDDKHAHELPDNESVAPKKLADSTSDYAGNCSVAGTWETLLWDLWRMGCEQLGINGGSGFQVETGCLVYFHHDDWMAKAGADRRYPTNKPIHALLRKFAESCRVIDDADTTVARAHEAFAEDAADYPNGEVK